MLFLLAVLLPITVKCEDYAYINEESSYKFYILDNAGLFSDGDTDYLYYDLENISYVANVGIVTLDENTYSDTESFANHFLLDNFGDDVEAIVFVIDMDNRVLTIWSDGKIRSVIEPKSTTIVDNVYTYASDGDYLECAKEVLSEIDAVINGQRIAQPMKYLSNACISVLIALIFSYVIAMGTSSSFKAKDSETLEAIFKKFEIKNADAVYTHTTREYSPESSSSSGGSSGGGGGGGGGGSHGF